MSDNSLATQEDTFPIDITYTTSRNGKSPDLAPMVSNASSLGLRETLSRTFSRPREGEVYYATGRGGAGNLQKALQLPSPQLVPVGSNTPNIQHPVYSTGRGGRGNMFSNDDPKVTRKAQDVGEDSVSPVVSNIATKERNFAVGRGGFGNVITPSKSNALSPRPSDPRTPEFQAQNHYTIQGKKKGGFLGKVKELFSN
ncbi:hypothetical protein BABINDRAFT_159740 [Babjeviella inositovora NRRL Y-12698]|uniref:Protein PAR32 n=1 Tax=Babjeviella inositovora NRRL Y-12698 TaxID=984486 RepID=A0A1E3QUT5_9ASCO|nr:uncharacterized protein BABINDRAFT_159740 [Babjeviella inositovora NRRL Y-12698]ODQ81453.1 hypothetical protein BABINDRAFT_159740 [Babjeviella inositovora NRRL Y-12698]